MNTELLPQVIPLWSEDTSPDAASFTEQQTIVFNQGVRFRNAIKEMKVVRNVSAPSLTAYWPDPQVANGTAVLICPGGGFTCLCINHEGVDVANWLTMRGIAAFVLKCRLLPTALDEETFLQQMRHPDMAQINAHMPAVLADGQQSIRLVRERASQWRIDPQRIGIIGFSAGGLVATSTAAHSEAACRPNFVAYSPGWQDLVPQADALPLFLAFASDDPVLSLVSEGTMRLYSAWESARQPIELHVSAKGGHGFGMAQQGV